MTTHTHTPLRIGIVGTGEAADRNLAPALATLPDAVLWSVLGRTEASAQKFAAKHGAQAPNAAHAIPSDFLADRSLDAVIVASPDGLHCRHTLMALACAKHVLVEKPMALNFDDAYAMWQQARTMKRTLAVAYHHRWHEGHRLLRQRIDAGAIGDIVGLDLEWHLPATDASNWRASDPNLGRWWSLGAVGSHLTDLAAWFVGVRACGYLVGDATYTDERFHSGSDERARVKMVFECGDADDIRPSIVANIHASVVDAPRRRIEIRGTKGIALCEWTLGGRGAGSITIDEQPLEFEPANPYAGMIADFAAAIRDGREPEVGGYTGVSNVGILDRADSIARAKHPFLKN